MASWGAIVFLAAIAGIQVFADEFAYPENARGLSTTRIVSGWEAREGQIPWQLSLRMVNPTGVVNSCGGSIIHPKWGLTAAHCTANDVTIVIRAGAVSLSRPELIFETTQYFNHPQFIDALASIVQPHDIAILKFQRSITFSDRVQPIRVQNSLSRSRNYEGVRLEASGWGRTWTNGATPENLQWVYLSGDSNSRCRAAFGGSSIIVDSTICASAYNVTSQSTCQGDSGGPLVEKEKDGKYTLVGITSFVSALGCHADMPAGFIRPGYYHKWITKVTGKKFDWVPSESESSESSESSSSESGSSSSESVSSSSESSSSSSESGSSSSESGSSSSESKPSSSESSSSSSESGPSSSSSESGSSSSKSSSSSSSSESGSSSSSSESGSSTSESGSSSSESGASSSESGSSSSESGSSSSESKPSSSESSSSSSESGPSSSSSESKPSSSESSSSSSESGSSSSSSSSESKPSSSESSSSSSESSSSSSESSSSSSESSSSSSESSSSSSESSSSSSESSSSSSSSESSEESLKVSSIEAPKVSGKEAPGV